MLLPTALTKLWIYQVLPFIVSRETLHRSRIKGLVWNYTGVPIMNFIPDLQSKIVKSSLQINLSEN